MNNQNLSEYQSILLKVFKHFAEFCSRNGIQYYAAYGTMIGAIRHQGFIPWDDDMDVFMKRKDYDRFITLRKTVDKPYKIATYLDGDCPYPYAKFYTTEGTIWEFAHFPFVYGPWLDIFPLDECNGSKDNAALEAYHYATWKYRKAIAYASWKEIGCDLFCGKILQAAIKTVKKTRYAPFRNRYIRQIKKAEDLFRAGQGNSLVDYSGAIVNEVFSKSWFDSTLQVPFEDTVISIPNGYHQYLSYLYGDYMQLPPEGERKVHIPYFIDLKHSLTIEEIQNRYKSQLIDKQSLPLRTILDELRHRAKGWKSSRIKE